MSAPSPAQPLQRVYVWDAVVRMTHWLIALSIVALAATGIYMGNPFVTVKGTVFLMGTVKVVHFYFAIVFTLSVLVRIGWMFVGPEHARWHQFIPASKERRRNVGQTFMFYTFLRRDPPRVVGHNALAGAAYALVFILYLVMITSGLALYSVSAHGSFMKVFAFLQPLYGGVQSARFIHHLVMWLLLGFVVHHIWSGVLMSRMEGSGLMDSIFSGNKFFPKRSTASKAAPHE